MFNRYILFGIFLVVSSSAYAQQAMFNLPVSPELIAFVSTHTGVNLPNDIQIGVIDNSSQILDYKPVWTQGIVLAAAGVEVAGKIYLPVRSVVHLQEDKYRAIVVHELTHIAQDRGHRHFACTSQREAQAYEIQNVFLAQNGLPPAMDDDALAEMQHCHAE